MRMPTLLDYFLDTAARRPDRAYLKIRDIAYSYGAVARAAATLRNRLVSEGISPGDRVAILDDESAEAVAAIFGVWMTGAVMVPCSSSAPRQIEAMLEDCDATVMVVPRTSEWGPSDRYFRFAPVWEDTRPVENERQPVTPDTVAAIIYTSGSKGEPKGVTMLHRNMVAAAETISGYLQNEPGDIVLDTLPLSFDYGLYQFLMAPLFAGTIVYSRNLQFPMKIADMLQQERVTGFPGTPTILAMMVRARCFEGRSFPDLRYISSTGAMLPESTITALRRALGPGVQIYSMYGLTECKRVSYLPPHELDRRPGSVGRPMNGLEARIVDPDGRALPAGETGELIIRGNTVMRGYWNRPETNARVLRVHDSGLPWLHTGDRFHMDDDGYLYFHGRIDDVFKSGGHKVAPVEVERQIVSLAGVSDAVVCGEPHQLLGLAVRAFVIVEEGASWSEDELRRALKDKLEPHAVPHRIEFVERMPLTRSGKTDRHELLAHRTRA